jgi:eukaryotic-like serine/threonine-protein kinase
MELTPTHIEELQQLFERALELPEAQQSSFVESECHGNTALGDEVKALLRAHASSSTALNRPVELGGVFSAQDDESRWVGTRLGPWRVTRRIGQGGMGTVYEAMRADDQFEKRVAVKFLHHHAGHPSVLRRFIVERQILANLNHPNIATLIDGGVTADGKPYLVMEFVDGEPITAWGEAQSLDQHQRIVLYLQVCAAVEAAHNNLIVHRDLKPGNILVSKEGRVKLLDFGIARLLDEQVADLSPVRSTDLRSFTPDYAAPEQILNQPVSTSTDVFALGVVLYKLLTQRMPFAQRTNPAAIAAPAELNPDLDAILAKALRPLADQRYSTVAELRSELERYLEGRPVAAHPDSRRYRVGKFFGRHRAGSIATALAVIAVLGLSGIALWQGHRARKSAADTQQLNAFLMDVLKMSNPFDEGEEMTLSAALDEAAKQIDERFKDRPDLSAEIRFGIGYSMVDRYRLEQAETQLQQALTESIKQFGQNDIRTLRVVEGIAGLRLEQSRFGEAEVGYKQAIKGLELSNQRSDPLYANAIGNLGNLYLQQERYPESDRLFKQALAVEQKLKQPDADLHADLLNNLAHAVHGLEDYPRADQLYGEAENALLKLYPNGSPDLAILLNNRGLLREEMKDLPGAIALHRRSLEMRRKVFHNEHPMVVTALGSLARLLVQAGQASEALPLATEGAAMADRVYTSPNRFHPSLHATLASAQLANGETQKATLSVQKAQQLLSKLEEPPPSNRALG